MRKYSVESGIKVLDRAIAIAHAAGQSPASLTGLCESTGLPRATVHRLATALEVHGILTRTAEGLWVLGHGIDLFHQGLIEQARPTMLSLLQRTGESVQLYQHTGDTRTCVAAEEPDAGLRNTVPVGTHLPLTHGSGARIMLAYADPGLAERVLPEAAFTADDLAAAKKAGLAESVSEREVGLASVSAPILDDAGGLIAVLSISGPAERLRPSPAAKWGEVLLAAAARLSASPSATASDG